MDCILTLIGPAGDRFLWRCERCHRTLTSKYDDPRLATKRRCNAAPTLVTRTTNFAQALARHIANGSPKCDEAQIAERLSHCETCPLLVNDVCTHRTCGCPATRREVFRNKLAWADQECPLGKWPKADLADR